MMSDESVGAGDMLITPDFSEARDYTMVPAGSYSVEVLSVKAGYPRWVDPENPVYPKSGDTVPVHIRIDCKIFNMPEFGPNRCLTSFEQPVTGTSSGRALAAIKALNPSYDGKGKIDPRTLIGKKAVARVEVRHYRDKDGNDQETNEVRGFAPLV